ncbi:MAG: S8 family serine peptidase [Myxococcota bacterium]
MFKRSSCAAVVALVLCSCQTQTPDAPVPVTPGEELPRFTSDPTLTPTGVVDESGPSRELARLVGPSNKPVDFVLDEVLLTAPSRADAESVAARWKGRVLDEVSLPADRGAVFRLRVDPTGADVSRLPEFLRKITPASHGEHRVSSTRALQLLALATQEAVEHQSMIGLNFLFQSSEGLADGKTADGWNTNLLGDAVFTRHTVDKAWQVLSAAGRLTPQITAAIMDSGFVQNPDLPADTVLYPDGAWRKPNSWGCGGGSCPWHGTDVASAFAGQLDNGYGSAGPAGPVTKRLVLVRSPDADLWQILAYLFDTLPKALGEHPRIINISATFTVPGFFGFLCKPAEWAISALRHGGTIVFAAAGNKGQDVDEEDCFIACWEADVYVPCELDDVVCVGGVESAVAKAPGSNFGRNQRGSRAYPSAVASDNSVDLFGPYTMLVGPTADSNGIPFGTGTRTENGTSFASPFVAGVAALVWAANPQATADQVVSALIDTAKPFGGSYSPRSDMSGRMVDAYAAVKPFIGNVRPRVTITSPANGSTILVGGPFGVAFEAVAKDWEDSELELTWSSNLDGVMGTGAHLNYTFTTLGTRDVHVVVRDSQGLSSIATITVTIANTPPQVSIAAPAQGEEVVMGLAFQVSANTGYPTNSFRTLSCTWTSDNAADTDFPRTGCLSPARFFTVGPRTLTLTVVDQYGTSATSSVSVTAVPPGVNPVVTITSPAIGGSATVNDLLVLNGNWLGGVDPSTYVWRWQSNFPNCPEVDLVTTAPSIAPPMVGRAYRLWDTSTALQVPSGCGYGEGEVRLYVTDSFNRVSMTAVPFRLNYQLPPH